MAVRQFNCTSDYRSQSFLPDENAFKSQLYAVSKKFKTVATLTVVNGKPINLYRLYILVLQLGGYYKVTQQKLWNKIASELKLPPACCNVSVAIRKLYFHHLIRLERDFFPLTHFDISESQKILSGQHNPHSTQILIDKYLGVMDNFNSYGNYYSSRSYPQFNQLNNSLRLYDDLYCSVDGGGVDQFPSEYYNLRGADNMSTNLLRLRESSLLEGLDKSLASGLPNELDMSLNTLLLLSTSVQPTALTPIRLSHYKHLLSLILASVGLHEDHLPKSSYQEMFRAQCGLDYTSFWRDQVGNRCWARLSSDTALSQVCADTRAEESAGSESGVVRGPASPLGIEGCLHRVLIVATLLSNLVTPPPATTHDEDDDELEQAVVFEGASRYCRPAGREAPGSPRGGSRCLAVGLPPLSAQRDNLRCLSASPSALRFALLCGQAHHPHLRQLGHQLIASLRCPLEVRSGPPQPRTVWQEMVLAFLSSCLLTTSDRAEILTGLHLLGNLIRVPEGVNVSHLFEGLPYSVWSRIAHLLCLSDLGVVCAALEALYCVTGMGSAACRYLWRSLLMDGGLSPATICMQPLIALLTIEAQSMGLASLQGIKVIQRNMSPPFRPQTQMTMPGYFGDATLPYSPNAYTTPPVFRNHMKAEKPSLMPYASSTFMTPFLATDRQQLTPFPPLNNHQEELSPLPTGAANGPPVLEVMSPSLEAGLNQFNSCSRLVELLNSAPTVEVGSQSCSPTGGGAATCEASAESPADCPASLQLAATKATDSPPGLPLVVPPAVANVKPQTNSLSELTDRLQMPPPSLPPPSALRRAARQQQQNASTTNRLLPTAVTPPRQNHSLEGAAPDANGFEKSPDATSRSSNRILNDTPSAWPDSSVDDEEVAINCSTIPLTTSTPPSTSCTPPMTDCCMLSSLADSGKAVVSRPGLLSFGVNGINKQLASKLSASLAEGKAVLLHADKAEGPPATLKRHSHLSLLESWGHHAKRRRRDRSRGSVDDQLVNGTGASNGDARLLLTARRLLLRKLALLQRRHPVSARLTPRRTSRLKVTVVGGGGEETPQPALTEVETPTLLCEWDNCHQTFFTPKQVSSHVYFAHIRWLIPQLPGSLPPRRYTCLWSECASPLERAPYALVAHLQEAHCSSAELESRRHHHHHLRRSSTSAAAGAGGGTSPFKRWPASPAAPTGGGMEVSGLAVMREVETRRVQADLLAVVAPQALLLNRLPAGAAKPLSLPPREGPVTKHIRVTAALILRNLVTHLPGARRWLIVETPSLCNILMGLCPDVAGNRSNDAARIVAQCLALCHSTAPLEQRDEWTVDLDA